MVLECLLAKSEVNFGGDDQVTCFVAYKGSKISIGGKISTATPGEIQFGILRYSPTGIPDNGFGVAGKVKLNWDVVSYPNDLIQLPDGRLIAAGVSASVTQNSDSSVASLFRLKADGTPDSTFGVNGRARTWFASDEYSEFDRIDTIRDVRGGIRYLATGRFTRTTDFAQSGFCAALYDSTGALDTSFGTGGKAKLPTIFALLSSSCHRMKDGRIHSVGMADLQPPELVMGMLNSNGFPDSSFGINGFFRTGLTSYETTSHAVLPTDSTMLVIIPRSPTDLYFSIGRFKLDGTPDSSYGIHGFTSSPLTSIIQPKGLTISNDGSALVCGGTNASPSQSVATKFFGSGVIDTTFGIKGVALLDADNGTQDNYLIGFVPVSQGGGHQRFIGVGTTHNSLTGDDFLVAGYVPTKGGVGSAPSASNSSLEVYPNPTHTKIRIASAGDRIEALSIVDALGRTILTLTSPQDNALDVSSLPDGIYRCTIQTPSGSQSRNFVKVE